MPLNIDILQILLHMLNFVILAGGLTLLLFNPVRKFIEKRQKQFEAREAENRENAQKNENDRIEYERKLAEFENEAEEMRQRLEQEAADTAKEYIDSAKAEADAIIAKAEADAEKRKEQILDSAQTEIGELVISAAQKLLADTATPERTQDLYDAFIEQASAGARKKADRNGQQAQGGGK
ncbi:MAG: ATP synthase F0 subunit B [Clostridia bacterium]|nr:ATP synthase F0 subunit B [Clostridia bacterium]